MGSKFTTKLVNIFYTFDSDLEKTRQFLFDFEYPLPQHEPDKFKEKFETMFIQTYFFHEIGFETVGRFKFYLKNDVNIKMDYYSRLFDNYYKALESDPVNTDVVEKITTKGDTSYSDKSNTTSNTKANGSIDGFTLSSNTPQTFTKIEDIKSGVYADFSSSENSKNSSNSDGSSSSNSDGSSKNNVVSDRNKKGIEGLSVAQLFNENLKIKNLFEELIFEFKDLFMLIY